MIVYLLYLGPQVDSRLVGVFSTRHMAFTYAYTNFPDRDTSFFNPYIEAIKVDARFTPIENTV